VPTARVEARLNEAETRTQRLLAERRPEIERIARVLMEKRDLDATAISALLSSAPNGTGHTMSPAECEASEIQHVDRDFLKETPDAQSL